MSKLAVFWDSSALVPLCVQEITSRQAQSQLRKSMPVVWWGSSVEVHSAIARLHRLGKLNDLDRQGALSRLNLLSRGWREILPGDSVRDLAMGLLDTHELRAADSFQLAAALTCASSALSDEPSSPPISASRMPPNRQASPFSNSHVLDFRG
jgi:predicted nucleic acid-binding protein